MTSGYRFATDCYYLSRCRYLETLMDTSQTLLKATSFMITPSAKLVPPGRLASLKHSCVECRIPPLLHRLIRTISQLLPAHIPLVRPLYHTLYALNDPRADIASIVRLKLPLKPPSLVPSISRIQGVGAHARQLRICQFAVLLGNLADP